MDTWSISGWLRFTGERAFRETDKRSAMVEGLQYELR
jgi:hypothetical protein